MWQKGGRKKTNNIFSMAYNYTILMATYLEVVSDPDPGVRTEIEHLKANSKFDFFRIQISYK